MHDLYSFHLDPIDPEMARRAGGAQLSSHSLPALAAQAAVVCDGVSGLHLGDLRITWPESGTAAPFQAGWFNAWNGLIDAPFAQAA